MPTPRKEWIRPAEAARILDVARATVTYRAGTGRYRSKRNEETDTLLVNRSDVVKDKPRSDREKRERALARAARTTPLPASAA